METVSLTITNELARTVGKIAARHPDRAIEIRWAEGQPEETWIVAAHNGDTFDAYLADDESGTYVVAHEDTLRAFYPVTT